MKHRFKKGDMVYLANHEARQMQAPIGTRAVVVGYEPNSIPNGEINEFLTVAFENCELQMDGAYQESMFEKEDGFRVGDMVCFRATRCNYSALKGASALVTAIAGDSLVVSWKRDGLDKGQMDGGYAKAWFRKQAASKSKPVKVKRITDKALNTTLVVRRTRIIGD